MDTQFKSQYSDFIQEPRSSLYNNYLGTDIYLLAILITSYFYVLPLGQYTILGFTTDIRIYDFVSIVVILIITSQNWSKIKMHHNNRDNYYFWARLLISLVWFSLILTALFGGFQQFLPSVIRAYRFTVYLLTPTLIVTVVNSPPRQRFLIGVFYFNIVIQALLAFAQGIDLIDSLWPNYWLIAFGSHPVGTLSPHHLQIAVVMILGLAITTTFFRFANHIIYYILIGIIALVMLCVVIFSGFRSVWFVIPIMLLAFIVTHKRASISVLLGISIMILIVGYIVWDQVKYPIQNQITTRYSSRVEIDGFFSLLDERVMIYSSEITQNRIKSRPWVLLIGSGFQNVRYVLSATGAHNNFLQAWFELGIVGLLVYLLFLKNIWTTLSKMSKRGSTRFENIFAMDVRVVFIGVLGTMFFNETLWAQYSMFTTTGQILVMVGLATCSLNWVDFSTDLK